MSFAQNNNVNISSHKTYELDGTPYIVGEEAQNSKMKISSRDIDFILRFYPLVIKHVMDKMNVKPEKVKRLVVGLPPEDCDH